MESNYDINDGGDDVSDIEGAASTPECHGLAQEEALQRSISPAKFSGRVGPS